MANRNAEDIVQDLRRKTTASLKGRFVGRDEAADLIALAAVAGEHLFLLGPPGTAKSALIRLFAQATRSRYFEYLLTRFSEPNEIFGPIDLAKLRDGVVATVTDGMLPDAEFVFLDELFNANSAILNSLLTVLNERTYRRGLETHRLPLISLFAAANHVPEDETLKALFDRFLVRCQVGHLKRDEMPALLEAGWALERDTVVEAAVSADDLRELARRALEVDLSGVLDIYASAVLKVRDSGVELSDRRAVKALKLVAASAVLCGRDSANPTDLWVLRYLWDRPEQAAPLRGLIDALLKKSDSKTAAETGPAERHPLSRPMEQVDAEELTRRVEAIERELRSGGGGEGGGSSPSASLGLSAAARLRERLGELETSVCWLPDESLRKHLLGRIAALLERLQ